jgi:N-acetylneuraminate synthase
MIIIAEISGNHGGYLAKAKELIKVASECGCDYAKFQYYRPGDMYGSKAEIETYRDLHVPYGWLQHLFDCARDSGIGLFASIFSMDGVKDLLPFKPHYFKLASPQSTWLPRYVYRDILDAIPNNIKIITSEIFTDRASVLFCPPGHPPLLTDNDFYTFHQGSYDGFSDHTPGLAAPVAFARLGARIIEKHLKLDNNCIDASFSATPKTMKTLVQMLK